jgi:hypothetical protein
MGMGTIIIILTLVMSFGIYMAVPEHPAPMMFSISGGKPVFSFFNSLSTSAKAIVGVAVALGIGVGLISFPNPYLIFAGITTFLFILATFPMSLFTNAVIPVELKALFGSIFGILYILAILSWYKGGDTP